MWEDAPSSLYCCMLSLCCSQSFQKRLAAFLRRPVPSKANTQSTLCYLDLMAAESRAALMARMKRAGLWTCSVTRGETLTERGKRWRSAHPWLHSSCHRPTSSRITWNPNWFFFFFLFFLLSSKWRGRPQISGDHKAEQRWSGIKQIRRQ